MSAPAVEGITTILLTKNSGKYLEDCLASLRPFIRPELGDELIALDTGSTDNTVALLKASGFPGQVLERPDLCVAGMHDLVRQYLPDQAAKITEDPQFKDGFLADFAAARQICTDAAKNDLIFWLDSDDVLDNGSALRDYCTTFFQDPAHPNLFLQYDYSFDDDGSCNTVLWRERVVRRSVGHWAGVCHESFIPNNGQPQTAFRFPPSKLIHKHGRHHTFSDIRNYAILRHAWETATAAKDWVDPRWEMYLGNACRGLSMWQECIDWFTRVLFRSGSRDDRLACALNIGYCHILFGRPWRALDWFFQAQKIHPSEPRAYFGIARCYFELKRHKDAILYTDIGLAIPTPAQIAAVDPNMFDFYPGIFRCLALKELGDVQGAMAQAEEVARLRPNSEDFRDLQRQIVQWAQEEQIKSALAATTSLAFSQEGVADIIQSLRPEIRKLIPELQFETYCAPPKKSITFLCGKTFEEWDPTSCATGVGGSEKMVILLAKEFAKAGYRVDVYGSPKPENRYKNFDGVTYRPTESFNPNLDRDILIIWRNHGYLDLPLHARKIFVDLHDVQDPAYYSEARIAKVAGYLFKSEFHASTVRDKIPADKVIITRNGIDPEHFFCSSERALKRVLYTSSADRGLKRALRIFTRVKAIHPDAEMRAFYGFTPLYYRNAAAAEYQYFGCDNCERHMLEYAEECFDLGLRAGVEFKGRIGHADLAKELSTASVILYPTRFPEISCMSSMEAQAAGCIPVVSASGALPETTKAGLLMSMDATDDEFVAAIDKIFRSGTDLADQRAGMASTAAAAFDIRPLATDWLAHFER